MVKMQYNECDTCKANNGRCGNCHIRNDLTECRNCYETRKRGEVYIDATLRRSDAELERTFAILTP